ncbi:hypothetical protein [Chitinophaga nivalis]|uniref:DUF2157 domain-containing protein n=1 Tax=Chitinophaga nivalis TaxID=2991709 RepID=A0ABT3IGN9_9BACT|nr:hypothetical protein [Chitinophaga nivalis]MCW3467359.1 hypothetical protein [Chitinophaga nivalis]MCW3482949.1 hypothetical protein [Chitinophaga nivalis]
MIAYNTKTLDNLEIQQEAAKALRKDCINTTTYKAIEAAHPVDFYTPNPVIQTGLFLLTAIIIAFSLGLVALIILSGNSDESAITGICLFMGLACYGALELFIKEKKLYRAGVDEALLWGAVGLLLGGLAFNSHFSTTTWCGIVLLLSALAALRFVSMVMTAVAFLALIGLLFSWLIQLGTMARMVIPFAVILFSLLLYLAANRLAAKHAMRHYQSCLTVVAVLSLLTFYLGGNYYVVREVSNTMFDMELAPGQSISGGWFFWAFTVIVPLVYLYLGVRKKDAVLLRTGLLLLAMIVFTIRYYHSVLPLETAMVLGGIVLTGGSWALIRYLREPRNGFTYLTPDEPSLADKLKIESLIITQTFGTGTPTATGNDMKFGGGSGGGGGASDSY